MTSSEDVTVLINSLNNLTVCLIKTDRFAYLKLALRSGRSGERNRAGDRYTNVRIKIIWDNQRLIRVCAPKVLPIDKN